MRLRTKFLFSFLAVGLFPLAGSLATAYGLRVVARDVDHLQIYAQADDICGQIKAELAQIPDVDLLIAQAGLYQLMDHADRSLILCRSLAKLSRSEKSQGSIAAVESTVSSYRRLGRVYSMAKLADPEAAKPRELEAARAAYDKLKEVRHGGVIQPIGNEAHQATKLVIDRAETINTWVIFGGLGLSLICTVVAAFVLARATVRPIVKLLRAAREIGHGNLDVSVPVSPDEELRELGNAFNEMTRRLRGYYDGLEEEVRKRTEELRRREKDLEQERRLAAIGRLAAGVAHEVSNPLTVIAGAAEGLRDRAKDEELKEVEAFEDFPDYLEAIENEAYRLKKVVRRLLDFSRSGPTVLEALDMREVVRDAVSLAQLDPRAKASPLSYSEPSEALSVRGDADALKEAILNLLFNALAAVEGGGTVSVSAGLTRTLVSVEVVDTGMGIDPQDQERMFEPFFTTRREGEGTGLGLSLVYETVGRHDGTVTGSSAGRGHGAAFRITLPRILDRA